MESADQLVARAAAEFDAGRIEAAVDLARRATEIDPRSAVASGNARLDPNPERVAAALHQP